VVKGGSPLVDTPAPPGAKQIITASNQPFAPGSAFRQRLTPPPVLVPTVAHHPHSAPQTSARPARTRLPAYPLTADPLIVARLRRDAFASPTPAQRPAPTVLLEEASLASTTASSSTATTAFMAVPPWASGRLVARTRSLPAIAQVGDEGGEEGASLSGERASTRDASDEGAFHESYSLRMGVALPPVRSASVPVMQPAPPPAEEETRVERRPSLAARAKRWLKRLRRVASHQPD